MVMGWPSQSTPHPHLVIACVYVATIMVGHVEALLENETDASIGIKRCFFAPRILGAKLGAKSRPLQTVQNQQVPDFMGCSCAWSGVGVQ